MSHDTAEKEYYNLISLMEKENQLQRERETRREREREVGKIRAETRGTHVSKH